MSALCIIQEFRNASVAQLDRVLGYEPSGRRFESSRMHHSRVVFQVVQIHQLFFDASVAQLDRVPGYEPGGRRFESSRMHHFLKAISLTITVTRRGKSLNCQRLEVVLSGGWYYCSDICTASVAQLDRVPGYEPGGRRFESSRMHHHLPHSLTSLRFSVRS